MISDLTTNHDPTGEASSIILSGRQLTAACRKLVAAVLRRPTLIPSVLAVGFRAERDLANELFLSFWRLAASGTAVRLLLPVDQELREIFSNPVVELDSRAACALARQIKRSRQVQADARGRYMHLPVNEPATATEQKPEEPPAIPAPVIPEPAKKPARKKRDYEGALARQRKVAAVRGHANGKRIEA